MENFTIINEKSGTAISFYATDYDRQFKKYRFWVGDDKVAEIPEEGYSIIEHVTEKAYKDAQRKVTVDDLVSAVQAEMRENHKGLLDKLRGDIK